MWRYLAPAALSIAGLAMWLALGRDEPRYVLLGIAAHVLGADWLLLALRTPASTAVSDRNRRMLRLAVGAPTALFFLVALGNALLVGDLAWDVVVFAVVPMLLVWPFVLLTFRGVP